MSNSINKVSPSIRDKSLNRNIGKYSQIKEILSTPIGEFVDIYNSTSDYLSSKSPNGLLYYTNDKIFLNKKGDLEETFEPKYFKYRDNNPINIDYSDNVEQKYYYADGMGYNDTTTNTEISSIVKSVVGLGYGDGVSLDFSGGGVKVDSASLETATSLVNRVLEETTYNKTTLGTIGLKKLGTTLLNASIQNTSNQIARNLFYKRKLENEKDYAQIDSDILGLIPFGKSKISQKILPIYFYKQIRENNLQLGTDISIGTSWVNDAEEMIEHSTDNNDITVKYYEDLNFNKNSLLYKTSQMFRSGRIETLITNTKSKIDGDKHISKGRGLKGKKTDDFLRTWTTLNKYNRISSLIRPFNDEDFNILKKNLDRVRPNNDNFTNNTVLQRDGFVKIAPYKSDDFKNPRIDNKKYMFSIENLAWKDSIDSTIKGTSQEGPNGGRIMWFPPYDISINESSNVNWHSETFIGRGEAVRTYVDTERSATLNFTMIVDHPSIINYYKEAHESGQNIEEEDYLKLFAGEEIVALGAKTNEESLGETPVVMEIPPKNKPRTVSFKVYFPNNLSGIDHIDNPSVVMRYLHEGKSIYINATGDSGYEMGGSLNDSSDKPIGDVFGKFCYVVDSAYKDQKLNEKNYKSIGNNNLNKKSDNTLNNQHSFEKIYKILTNEQIDEDGFVDVIKNANKIEITGSASGQGNKDTNDELSGNRMLVVLKWLQNFNKKAEVERKNVYGDSSDVSSDDVNHITNKEDRFVSVVLTADPNDVDDEQKKHVEGLIAVVNQYYKEEVGDNNKSSTARRVKKSMYGSYYDKNNPNDNKTKRYNDESAFFESIGLSGDSGINHEKNIIMNKLSEKIKHFHPGFHSSTPEGFNTRLTFLHQCTRQGPTSNFSSTSETSATNMAFGRPPVCILRLGDFYNTKITINSLTISYDPLVWDLNEEGIGVQPMLAKITMGFNFIGGSDLTGDIARLQNAVTFNYFANTGVYDDRNDRIESRNGGNKEYEALYNPGVYDSKE